MSKNNSWLQLIFAASMMLMLSSCGEQNGQIDALDSSLHNSVDAMLGEKDDPSEFTEVEYFNQKEEGVKYFLGQFKDIPDPEFDPYAPLKIPNQDDVEALFKYLRKYRDSIDLNSPDSEAIKRIIYMNEDGKIDFSRILEKFRFKPIFRDVSFSLENITFNRAKGVPGIKPVRYVSMFKDLIMNNVEFDSVKLEDVDFSGSKLSNVTINDSSFSRTLCHSCEFNNVKITNSTSKDADFSFSSGTLDVVDSHNSYFKATEADFERLNFKGGSLRNSVFINTKNAFADDTEGFNNVEDGADAPATRLKNVGLIYKNAFPGGTAYKIHNIIRAKDFQPIKIEYGLENIIPPETLHAEVRDLFNAMDKGDSKSTIVEKLLTAYKNDPARYPVTQQIENMVKGYVAKLDAVVIPGGLDVEPYFYNANLSPESFYGDQLARLRGKKGIVTEENPIRSILEILLIDHAKQKQLPLLLICRGAHLYNIATGGKMIENLPDLYDNVDFSAHLRFIEKAKDLSTSDAGHRIIQIFDKQGKRSVPVYGNHHQAVDQDALGQGLRTLLVWNMPNDKYISYAMYDQNYAPGAWLVQFHPEVKEEHGGAMSRQLSELNDEIYDSFFDIMGNVSKQQRVPKKEEEQVLTTPSAQTEDSQTNQPPALEQPATNPSTDTPTTTTPSVPSTDKPATIATPSTWMGGVARTRIMPYVVPAIYAYPVYYPIAYAY